MVGVVAGGTLKSTNTITFVIIINNIIIDINTNISSRLPIAEPRQPWSVGLVL